MDVKTGLFYLFAAVLLFAAFRVITARNPVYAALYLVLAFFQAAAVWILLKAEFLAISLVLVYVGAVMVLFLFVVMMLDINFADLRRGAMRFIPLGISFGGVLLAELILLYASWSPSPLSGRNLGAPTPEAIDNSRAIGNILYTDFVFPFQVSGLILLVAMIGAIVLTLRSREGLHRQSVPSQVGRKVSDVLTVQKVVTGAGVDHDA